MFYFDRFSKWEVHAGALNFTDVSEDGRMVVTSMDGRPHENYIALFITNDIGLVFLPEAVSGPSKYNFCRNFN
jgi:hypothetical protein